MENACFNQTSIEKMVGLGVLFGMKSENVPFGNTSTNRRFWGFMLVSGGANSALGEIMGNSFVEPGHDFLDYIIHH